MTEPIITVQQYELVKSDRARLRRELTATEQALLDCQARAEGAEKSGDEARAELERLRAIERRAKEMLATRVMGTASAATRDTASYIYDGGVS